MMKDLKFDESQRLETNRIEVEHYFGARSSGKAAQALKKDDPARYAELRELAQRLGLIGQTRHELAVAGLHSVQKKSLTAEDYALLEEFPKDKVREFIGSSGFAALSKTDAHQYDRWRAAAVLHGLLAPREVGVRTRTAPEPKPDNGELMLLDPAVAKELGLENGFRVTRTGREKAFLELGRKRLREAEDKAADERVARAKEKEQRAASQVTAPVVETAH